MKKIIATYYDELANDYDTSRFANTYGQFIHQQELSILTKYLPQNPKSNTLDLACGTGRFLNFATHGVDISPKMLKIAAQKVPTVNLQMAAGASLPFANQFFQTVFSFHLMMHLDVSQFQNILNEVYRVTQKGAYFIFDIPSAKRRKLTGYNASSWHGGNQISVSQLKILLAKQWELINYHGIAFLPIHRIPNRWRKHLISFDNGLSNIPILKEYASHIVYVLKKK